MSCVSKFKLKTHRNLLKKNLLQILDKESGLVSNVTLCVYQMFSYQTDFFFENLTVLNI